MTGFHGLLFSGYALHSWSHRAKDSGNACGFCWLVPLAGASHHQSHVEAGWERWQWVEQTLKGDLSEVIGLEKTGKAGSAVNSRQPIKSSLVCCDGVRAGGRERGDTQEASADRHLRVFIE